MNTIGGITECTYIVRTNSNGEVELRNAISGEMFSALPNTEFEVRIRTVKGTTTQKLRARYFVGIVKPVKALLQMRTGEIKSVYETHAWLKSMNPNLVDERGNPKSLSKDMCEQDLFAHIHYCAQMVAENWGVDLQI